MITIKRLTKYDLEQALGDMEHAYPLSRSFFGSFSVLHTFCNQLGSQVCLISNDQEKYIVLHKPMKEEWRFVFKNPSDAFITEFKEQIKPEYVTLNLVNEPTGRELMLSHEELVLDTQRVLDLGDHDFRKQYRRALRKNPAFTVSRYTPHDIGDLVIFLENWRNGRTEEQNAIARIENDLNFLAAFGQESFVQGTIIRDDGKVIGYNIFVPYFGDACVSVFGKVLRGYENLGVFLTYEKCKAMHSAGFSKAYLSGLNTDFKKSMRWAGETVPIVAERIYKGDRHNFRTTPEPYLDSLTWS